MHTLSRNSISQKHVQSRNSIILYFLNTHPKWGQYFSEYPFQCKTEYKHDCEVKKLLMGRRILERHPFPESECGHNFETQKQTLNGDSFEEKIPIGDTIEKKMHLP